MRKKYTGAECLLPRRSIRCLLIKESVGEHTTCLYLQGKQFFKIFCMLKYCVYNTSFYAPSQIESEGKPVTNQKNSGRCWLFAALNCIRLPFIKQYNLDEFEFSQGYLFYWDKIERCHYFLNNIIETASHGEEITGRLVSFLLHVSKCCCFFRSGNIVLAWMYMSLQDPTSDGGQWDMLVNLINKHGLMPKKCFPETYSCETSLRLNAVLKSKVICFL